MAHEDETDEESRVDEAELWAGSPDREADIQTVADFVVGWWPGLEDAISWGSDTSRDARFLAARRLRSTRPRYPEAPARGLVREGER